VVNLDLALVVVSDVDACVIDGSRYPAMETVRVLDALRAHGVPLVFCSSRPRAELEDLQAQLELDAPFVAENGGVLCVPQGYFPFDIPGATAGGGRLTVAFGRPRAEVAAGGRCHYVVADADKGRATAMLRRLYRKACGPLTLVGLGHALDDVPLLRSVDVPFVVRSADEPATRQVLDHVPWAEVTRQTGAAGWRDAVITMLGRRVDLREEAWPAPAAHRRDGQAVATPAES
jgi:predicted mannosyl-3-phosphoglycerate phosphatase (HAD superfamily)